MRKFLMNFTALYVEDEDKTKKNFWRVFKFLF